MSLTTLGAGTALLGKKGAMACTIAVEEVIGGHYNRSVLWKPNIVIINKIIRSFIIF